VPNRQPSRPTSAYVWGLSAAADYLGISRKTLWRIRNSTTITAAEKRLLQPRIINGQAAFAKASLDKFMNPVLNAPGAKVHDPFPHE
jgi:hypothetical protein